MEHEIEPPDKSAFLKELYGTDDHDAAYKLYAQQSDEARDGYWAQPPETQSKFKLPYYAPDDLIPQPLPTVQDIERARYGGNIAPRILGSIYDVYRVNNVFIVKFADSPSVIREAENMLFLAQQQPQLRIPKLYAAFSHQGGNPLGIFSRRSKLPTYYYVVMEYIEGICLSLQSWYETSLEFKKGILKQISHQLQLLRSISPPEPTYYGRIHGQPWSPCFNAFRSPREGTRGPYRTKEEFIEALSESTMHKTLVNNTFDKAWYPHFWLGLRYMRHILYRFEGWEPKMTHLDLKTNNIILRAINPEARKWWQWWDSTPISELKAEDFEVVLIDWAEACWMPAWVEIVNMIHRSPLDRWVWMSEMAKGLEKFYFAELGLFQHLEDHVVISIF